MTRSGGTLASCSTGGRPKPTSSVKPTPMPNSAGQAPTGGRSACTRPASNQTKTLCTNSPSSTPATLAIKPTAPNSSAYASAIERCGWPSTRSIAQSFKWRSANSRDAIATATAASNAASSATRFKNFLARSSVCFISGRPESIDSTRTPRSCCLAICSSAQRTNAETSASRLAGDATASR